MKAYKVTGTIKDKKNKRIFRKEFAASGEDDVREQVYSVFGSLYRVKRPAINIDEISEISPDDIEDHAVIYKVKGIE